MKINIIINLFQIFKTLPIIFYSGKTLILIFYQRFLVTLDFWLDWLQILNSFRHNVIFYVRVLASLYIALFLGSDRGVNWSFVSNVYFLCCEFLIQFRLTQTLTIFFQKIETYFILNILHLEGIFVERNFCFLLFNSNNFLCIFYFLIIFFFGWNFRVHFVILY